MELLYYKIDFENKIHRASHTNPSFHKQIHNRIPVPTTLSTMESLTTPNPISKARVNSKPYNEEKGHLYIIITWGKKRSKQKHFSFYAKDLKIPHFNTIFPPDYNWESDTFKLPNKKVTSHYFAFASPAQKYLKSMCDEFPKVQKEIECCYDGLFLKIE